MYADLALAHLALAHCDTALKIARRTRHWARSRRARAYWLWALGQIEAGCSKDPKSAMLRFEQAIQLFDRIEAWQFGARSRRNLAQLLTETGQTERALQLLQEALVSLKNVDLPVEVALTEQLMKDLAGDVARSEA
jgi:tetratricopeptide (TPR) repeat protein